MPFGAVELLAIPMGLLIMMLGLFLPIYAGIWIKRRRQNRPTASCWFGYAVIIGWMVALAAYAVWFLQGNWYGESGMTWRDVFQAALVLGVIIAIYAGLANTADRPPED
jgi:hypothetical protein